MSVLIDPIDVRFPAETEAKRKLRKRLVAAQIDATKRLERTRSGFAGIELDNAAHAAGRWAAAVHATEQQLRNALIGVTGQFVAANAFERAADGPH
jgi:hypothetical protein